MVVLVFKFFNSNNDVVKTEFKQLDKNANLQKELRLINRNIPSHNNLYDYFTVDVKFFR